MTGRPAEPSKEAVELADKVARAGGFKTPMTYVQRSAVVSMALVLDAALRAERERTLRENAAVLVALRILYHEHTEGCDGGHDHSEPLACVECRAADALGLPVPDEAQRPSLSAPPPEGGKA